MRATVCVSRLRESTSPSASADMRMVRPGASESWTSRLYSPRETSSVRSWTAPSASTKRAVPSR
jgi:hypothetical protein